MNLAGLIIGTLVMWVLTYGVALPLAKLFAGEGGSQANVATLSPGQSSPTAMTRQATGVKQSEDAIDSMPAEAFVIAHVLVMGAAGLLLGAIAGVFFIGVSTKGKMWPGIIAPIAGSLVGAFAIHP